MAVDSVSTVLLTGVKLVLSAPALLGVISPSAVSSAVELGKAVFIPVVSSTVVVEIPLETVPVYSVPAFEIDVATTEVLLFVPAGDMLVPNACEVVIVEADLVFANVVLV